MTYNIDLQILTNFTTVSPVFKNAQISVQNGCRRFTEMKRWRFNKVKRCYGVINVLINALINSLIRIYNGYEMANQPVLKQKPTMQAKNAMCKKCVSVSLSTTPRICSPNAENRGFSVSQISKPVK